jgi:uncharacterized protein (TIGR03435 family)
MTVETLIRNAYVTYATGHRNPAPPVKIEGGPAWIRSDRYEIEATGERAPTLDVMQGPLMQALLEERFKLQLHSETRGEIPIMCSLSPKAASNRNRLK